MTRKVTVELSGFMIAAFLTQVISLLTGIGIAHWFGWIGK